MACHKGCRQRVGIVEQKVFSIEYNGNKVGDVTVHPVPTVSHERVAEISYYVDEAFRCRGLATEALKRVSRLMLNERCYDVLFCNCYADNAASVRVIEKAGYIDTGKLVVETDAPERPIRVFFML